MKTVFVNCSPKKRFCASAYFLLIQRFFVGGKKVSEKLRTPADHARVLEQIKDADAVVFGLPLYVDGIPSHVLKFMEKMEAFCKENDIHLTVYSIANNGFIEGRQNEPLMQNFENFCSRAGLTWGGGVGIGGGVMLNVYSIVILVQTGLFLLNLVLTVMNTGSFFDKGLWLNYAENVAIFVYLNLGVFIYLARMGFFIGKRTAAGKKYTRIMIPSFIFILFADIFFVIFSIFKLGIFRGWLSKKKIEEG